MKKCKIMFLVMSLLFASQVTYAQTELISKVDTIEIIEANVVDSTIITMIDSALTFLRLPNLEFGTHYYTLYIKTDTMPVSYFDVNLFVEDYFIRGDVTMDMFNNTDKLLLNYKGLQILIYSYKDTKPIVLKYFEPSNRKRNFYLYYKKFKNNPEAIYRPDKYYEQNVSFHIGKRHLKNNYFRFNEYVLKIGKGGW